jgi:hypothetical protein
MSNSIRLLTTLLPVLLLIGCGMSEEDQRVFAQSACSVISSLPENAVSDRIKEVNIAREKLGKVVFAGRDERIRDAVKYGVCAELILDQDDYDQLLSKQIEIDKEQQQKRVNTAIYTCNVMGESRNMDAAFRIKELNTARTEIGGSMFLGTDKKIIESFKYGLCLSLVLEDSYEEKLGELKELERIAAANKAEEDRIALQKRQEAEKIVAAKKAEADRIAAAKKAEADRIAAAKKAEADRIAAAKKAEADRIAAKELARVIAERKKAVNAELSKYQFSVGSLGMYISEENIYLTIKYSTDQGMIASSRHSLILDLESIAIDFEDPELPDFINYDYEFSMRRLWNTQVSFGDENRLSRDERSLFVRKFGGENYLRIPKSAFKVIIKVKDVETYSPEPFEFECENFKLLVSKGLCYSWSEDVSVFKEPIEIVIQ